MRDPRIEVLEKVDLVIQTLTADTDNPVLDLNVDSDVSNDADATAAGSQKKMPWQVIDIIHSKPACAHVGIAC